MAKLRAKFEAEYPGDILDFYEPPLKAKWKSEEEPPNSQFPLRETAGKSSSDTLAAPFNQFFESIEEANWGFDVLKSTLEKLSGDLKDVSRDGRISLTLVTYSGEGIRLRLNFGKWAILTFLNRSVGENRIQYVCREDHVPTSSPTINDDNRFKDKIEGHTFVLTTCPVANMRNEASAEQKAFQEGLAFVASKFKDWEAGPWAMNHQPKVLQMVFDPELRDRLLRSGLEISVQSAEVSSAPARPGIAYWWLNANPKIWDFRTAPIGSVQTYTSHNEAGNKRQKFKHFAAVKPGDLLIGYVTTPDKEIVAICEITKALHGPPGKEAIESKN